MGIPFFGESKESGSFPPSRFRFSPPDQLATDNRGSVPRRRASARFFFSLLTPPLLSRELRASDQGGVLPLEKNIFRKPLSASKRSCISSLFFFVLWCRRDVGEDKAGLFPPFFPVDFRFASLHIRFCRGDFSLFLPHLLSGVRPFLLRVLSPRSLLPFRRCFSWQRGELFRRGRRAGPFFFFFFKGLGFGFPLSPLLLERMIRPSHFF